MKDAACSKLNYYENKLTYMYFVMEHKLLTVNNDLYTLTASLLTNGGRWIYVSNCPRSGYKTQHKLVLGGG